MANREPKPKPIHWAKLRGDGAVSPLCARVPRRLDLRRSSWTICDELVTCPRCLIRMKSPSELKATGKLSI